MKRSYISLTIFFLMLFSIMSVPPVSATRPGCYTDYRFDQSGPFYNFDIFVTWEVAPETAYIYPAFCFGFEAGSGGYMGTQIVGDTKKVLFSIWDIEEGAETAIPVSSNGRRFSGEGTGAQCPLDYGWVPNREYRLRIWAYGSDSNGENWIATIYDTESGVETTIGVIYLKNSRGYKGYGWLNNRASIFLEYFGGPDTCTGQPYSKVTWRGPYANNGECTASTAQVPFYPDCITNNVLSSGWPYVTHEAGNDVEETTPSGTNPWATLSAGILRVNVNNEEDDTLMVEFLVDNLTYSVKNIPRGTTLKFGDFTIAPGTHDVEIRWIEPTTGMPQESTETAWVNSGETTTVTLHVTRPPTQGTLEHFDLDYHGSPPNYDGDDLYFITVSPRTTLTLFFFYKEGDAGNEYTVRAIPEWDKSSYIAKEDNGGTESSRAWESGGQRYGLGSYTVPSITGTYKIRVVYRASSTPPTWDSYGRLLAEGVVTVSSPSNQPPTAYIDYISPSPATEGETVSFSGHGYDLDGSIVAYEWISNRDGFLSGSSSFSTSMLSVGTHTIYFKVEDDDGAWSLEETMTLAINEKEKEEERRCIIATATYGSELAPEVLFLRGFRNSIVLPTFAGGQFMRVFNAWYYSFSPSVAGFIAQYPVMKTAMRVFLYPLIGTLHLSSMVYSAFSFSPEIGIVTAGFVASFLIGIIYFTPPVTMLLSIVKLFEKKALKSKHLKLLVIPWLTSVALMLLGGITLSPAVMMFATSSFVLVTLISSATVVASRITQRFPSASTRNCMIRPRPRF